MNVSVKEMKPCRRKIQVEIPAQEVSACYERVLKTFSAKARIPGFRPGKVPREILEKRFSDEVRKEALQDLVKGSYGQALQEKGIHPVAYPEISEVKFEKDKPLTYEAEVDVRPEIKLHDYKGILVKRKKIEVTDQEVDSVLEDLRRRQAQFIDGGDRAAADKDFVVIDYECTIEGESKEERKNYGFELTSEQVFPEFRTAIIGMKKGDKKTIDVNFPQKFARTEWAGKKGVFQVTLHEVKEPRLPALDDHFAKEVSPHETLDALRKSIQENTRQYKETQRKEEETQQVLEILLKQNRFDIPTTLQNDQEERLWEDTQERLRRGGLDKEKIKEESKKLREKVKEEAAHQVRLAYIVEKIAREEKITVTREEVDQRIESMASQLGKDPNLIKKKGEERGLAEGIADRLINEKVMLFLLEHAKIEENHSK
jgi:trigger factor